MSDYKLICLTGLDRVGKATQARLLHEVLKPSALMTFPHYGDAPGTGHWAAQFVRAALDRDCINLKRQTPCLMTEPVVKHEMLVFPTKQEPYVFQSWQMADRMDTQAWIKETLKTSHIIADRYEVDALAYGAADGCSIDWLLATHRLYHPSDLAIVMVGQPFARPGETPDLNEKNQAFQDRVRRYFEAWGTLLGWQLLDVDPFRIDHADQTTSIRAVHGRICQIVNRELWLGVVPLSYHDVERITCSQSKRGTESTTCPSEGATQSALP